MQVKGVTESRLLGRRYVEVLIEGKAGRLSRKEAISAVAEQLGTKEENVGLVSLEQRAGSTNVLGRFYVYDSPEAKKRLHPEHLDVRTLSKEEREKLKQERKKEKTAQPAKEAKK